MDAYIDGVKARFEVKPLGVGGEATVYRWNGKAVKIFHEIDPSWDKQKAALWRRLIELKKKKLKSFPTGLPPGVIVPEKLVYDGRKEIIGYVMPLVSGAEAMHMLAVRSYRSGGVGNNETVELFRHLFRLMCGTHDAQVVIGDFNDLNVLFRGQETFLIDTDSMQFNGLPCPVATEKFLDPLLYGQDLLARPCYSAENDYYAYAVMLFKSLLFIHPYDGVHKDFPNVFRRAEAAISVFNKDVRYPKSAVPFKVLPDELLNYFHLMFDKRERPLFPEKMFDRLRWTRCSNCGAEHARPVCPVCAKAAAAIREMIVVKGRCVAGEIFKTTGRILAATVQANKLLYLYEENDALWREGRQAVMDGKADNMMRFGFSGDDTFIGKGEKLVRLRYGNVIGNYDVETLGNLTMFATNQNNFYAISGEYLARNNEKLIGQIFPGQTWFRAGEDFGFGFYRVGRRFVFFIFDAEKPGIDDSIKLPAMDGKVVDANCLFSGDYALFLLSRVDMGKTVNSAFLIKRDGSVEASLEEDASTAKILKTIHGKAFAGKKMLSATDDGLMLVVPDNGTFVEAKLFADTEPFVDESVSLLPAADGVYVVSEKKILKLKM